MRSAKMAEMRMVLHMMTMRKKSPMMENLAFLHCSSVIASKLGFNWKKEIFLTFFIKNWPVPLCPTPGAKVEHLRKTINFYMKKK